MKLNKKIISVIFTFISITNVSYALADEEKNIYINKIPNVEMKESKVNTVNNEVNQNLNMVNNINNVNNIKTQKEIQLLNSKPQRPNDIYFTTGGSACFEEAANYHNVDPWLLMSIAYVESRFNSNAKNVNKNGSYDTGMMQINSIWLSTLKKKGIDKSALNNPCASAYIGAWILADNIKRYGYNWRAIGAYNSGNPKIGLRYAKKVYEAHAKFTGIQNKTY